MKLSNHKVSYEDNSQKTGRLRLIFDLLRAIDRSSSRRLNSFANWFYELSRNYFEKEVEQSEIKLPVEELGEILKASELKVKIKFLQISKSTNEKKVWFRELKKAVNYSLNKQFAAYGFKF